MKFYTGFLPTPDSTKALFSAPNLPNIPESEWKEINRRKTFHDLGWYPDQIDTSGCTGFSTDMTVSKCRVINGQTPKKMSGAYTYSCINGGSDNGSNIGDALISIKKNGTVPEALCDVHVNRKFIYRENTRQFDSVATRYQGEIGFRIETPEEAAIGIQAGGILEFAVRAGRGFGDFDGEGVCRAVTGNANHAVHADGMKKTNGSGWCVDMQTWTARFGDKSRVLIPLDLLDRIGYQEMWLIFGVIDDSEDPHKPPTPIL